MTSAADRSFRGARMRFAARTQQLRLALTLAGAVAAAGVIAWVFVLLLDGAPPRPDGAMAAREGMSAPASGEPVSLDNAVARQAGEWGISSCLAEIATLSDFLTASSTYASQSFRRGDGAADAHLFSAAVAAQEQASGLRSLSVMAVAPVRGGGCDQLYSTIVHLDLACAQAQARHFPAFRQRIGFGDIATVYATEDGKSHAYMLPSAGGGCTVVKTQVIY